MQRKPRLVVVAGCTILSPPGCGLPAAPSSAPVPAPPTASTWLIAPSVPGAPASGAPPAGALAPASASVPTAEPDGAPPGTQTCTELGAAIKAASLMQPGV